jgi:hypothetical protein
LRRSEALLSMISPEGLPVERRALPVSSQSNVVLRDGTLNAIFQAAAEIEAICQAASFSFCLIGGLAVQGGASRG